MLNHRKIVSVAIFMPPQFSWVQDKRPNCVVNKRAKGGKNSKKKGFFAIHKVFRKSPLVDSNIVPVSLKLSTTLWRAQRVASDKVGFP